MHKNTKQLPPFFNTSWWVGFVELYDTLQWNILITNKNSLIIGRGICGWSWVCVSYGSGWCKMKGSNGGSSSEEILWRVWSDEFGWRWDGTVCKHGSNRRLDMANKYHYYLQLNNVCVGWFSKFEANLFYLWFLNHITWSNFCYFFLSK